MAQILNSRKVKHFNKIDGEPFIVATTLAAVVSRPMSVISIQSASDRMRGSGHRRTRAAAGGVVRQARISSAKLEPRRCP